MRYLFTPLAGLGYIFPAINIAEELRRRGHEVAFATDKIMQPLISHYGFQRIPCGEKDVQTFQVRRWFEVGEVVRAAKHVEYAHEQFAPDVLVASELATGALVAARRRQLPAAVLGFTPYLYPPLKPQTRAHQQISLEQVAKKAGVRHQASLERYCQVSKLLGVPVEDEENICLQNSPLLGDLYMLRSVPELEDDLDALPERVHLIGSCYWESDWQNEETQEAETEMKAWLENAAKTGRPILYVAHAWTENIPDFWPGLVEALKDEPVWVIGTKWPVDGDSFPDNFYIRPHVPYQVAFPYTQAVMAAATTSLVLAALTYGRPMILVGLGGEENHLLLERCEAVGVALGCYPRSYIEKQPLPENITPEKLKQLVWRLFNDPDLQGSARRLQQAFQQVDGPQRAADLLERLGAAGQPVLRRDVARTVS